MEVARLDVNFAEPSTIADPYPVYEAIRAAGRVVWNDPLGVWMVPGFDDCVEVLGDPQRFARLTDPAVAFWHDAPNMITVEGADHHRLRHCLSPFFTRSAVARWERRVAEVVDDLLAPLLDGEGSFDLIADFTKIPTVIVAEMLGVPEERHEDFRRWSNAIIGHASFGHESPETRQTMREALDQLNDYFTEEIERHRREQLDDLFGAMLSMSEMTPAEMRSTAKLLLISGYDTTAKLMSESLVVLEQHPDERRLLAEDPLLVSAGIEEVLRWRGASQMLPRVAVHDTVLGGTELTPGSVVYVLLIAANRDPSRWPDADRFDVRREMKSNLGFGFGPHLCLGAPLARLETKVALDRLLRLAPDYRLRGIDYGNSFFVRGPEQGVLDVSLRAAS